MKREMLVSRLGWIVAGILAVQIYFVKELLAAELVFAIAFVAVIAALAAFYTIGAVWQHGLRIVQKSMESVTSFARVAVRWMAQSEEASYHYPRSATTR